MEGSFVTAIVMLVSVGVSFALGRWFSRGWRARRSRKEQAERLAAETRQQRRARERRGGA